MYEKFITCNSNGMSIEALIRSLMVTHDNGSKGFRMVIVNVSECDDLNDTTCAEGATALESEFRERVVLDPCGKPALLVYNTVAAS